MTSMSTRATSSTWASNATPTCTPLPYSTSTGSKTSGSSSTRGSAVATPPSVFATLMDRTLAPLIAETTHWGGARTKKQMSKQKTRVGWVLYQAAAAAAAPPPPPPPPPPPASPVATKDAGRRAPGQDDAAYEANIAAAMNASTASFLSEQQKRETTVEGTPVAPGCVALTNQGATCYMNVALQVVFRCHHLLHALAGVLEFPREDHFVPELAHEPPPFSQF